MPNINTSHHLDSEEIPQLTISTHYVIDKDGVETEKLNFHVFKIHTTQGESNYFLHTDEQLQEFITELKHLVETRNRISTFH